MSAEDFLNKYRALCLESGFCLISSDSYEPVILSRIDPNSSNMDEVLDDSWVCCTLACFHYE